MKSAYELAMERLQESDPDHKPLTDEQKEQLSAIDKKYEAKIAEREIFLQGKLKMAQAARKAEEITQLQRQIQDERKIMEEEREAAKEKVRQS